MDEGKRDKNEKERDKKIKITQMTATKTRCLSQTKKAAVKNTSECQCSLQDQLCDKEANSQTALKIDWVKKEERWFIKEDKKKFLHILI